MKHFRRYWPLILIVVSVLFVLRNLKVVADVSLSFSESKIKIGEGENVPRDDSQYQYHQKEVGDDIQKQKDSRSIQGSTADGYATNTRERRETFTINNASSSSPFNKDNNTRVVDGGTDSKVQVKGPLIFDRTTGWQGYSHEQGNAFCKSEAGSRSICPYEAYCPKFHLFEGISDLNRKNNNSTERESELWAPVGSQSQPVWVSVGMSNPCLQRGGLDELTKSKVKFVMCCHPGEEKNTLSAMMPNVATDVNQTALSLDDMRCRSKCTIDLQQHQHSNSSLVEESHVIPPRSQRYCFARCRWLKRQKAVARLTNYTRAHKYDSAMTETAPLIEGRCTDLSDKLRYDGMCTSVAHRQKPKVNLVLSSNSWLSREMNLGLRDCSASRCDVSSSPGHSNSSHVYVGTIQPKTYPGQIDKVNPRQINVMVQPESLRNTNRSTPIQPGPNLDWIASHRQDGFDSNSWIPYSQINTDDLHFRIKGKSHGERRPQIPVFIRNCDPGSVHSDRMHVIAELGKYVQIEQFGRCDLDGATKSKLEDAYPECADQRRRSAMWDSQKEVSRGVRLLAYILPSLTLSLVFTQCVFMHSMFGIVAENSFEEKYLTEKLYQPLKMGTVPIIFGNSSLYRHHLPDPNAAIFLSDFDDYESAAKYIQKLISNPKLWEKHLEWKQGLYSDNFSSLASHSFATLPCDLCDKYAEEVFPDFNYKSLGVDTVDTLKPCIVDMLSRHSLPDNLPVMNPSLGFDAVFITHYTKLGRRKPVVAKRVRETLGVEPIFVTDFDKEDLTEDDMECFVDSEAQLAYIQRVAFQGEVSLTMKHFVIYYYMVKKSLDNVLILEDDAAFVYSDFTSHDSLWQHILANLPASYDMIFLSGFGRHNVGKKITDHIYLGQVSRVASMYMISQKGARNMLRSLPMVSIIDWHMNYAVGKDNEWMKKMPVGFHGPRTVDMQLYHTEPWLSYQDSVEGSTWRGDKKNTLMKSMNHSISS